MLTTGFSTQDQVLVDRLFDTAIGIVVGLAVNLLVWPPLRDYSAARAIDGHRRQGRRAAERHGRAAARTSCDEEQVAEWVDTAPATSTSELDQAWALLRQAKESGRLNPRRAARTVQARRTSSRECCATTSRPSRRRAAWRARSGYSIDASRRVGAGLPGPLARPARTRPARRSPRPTPARVVEVRGRS